MLGRLGHGSALPGPAEQGVLDVADADSVEDHAVEFRTLMRTFTYMWSTLFMLNAGLVISITWLASCLASRASSGLAL